MDIFFDNDIEKQENENNENNYEYITQLYEKKYILIINKIASLISKFHYTLKKLINDISNISITLGNQTICSKSLILEIKIDNEKYLQLNDRIEMINDTKKLLDNNLSITNNNLNIFILEVKKQFKELKNLRNQKKNQLLFNNSLNNNFNSFSKDKEYNNHFFSHRNNELKYDEKDFPINNILYNYNLSNRKNNINKSFKKTIKNNYFNYYKPVRNNFKFEMNENDNIFNKYENNFNTNHMLNNNYKKIHLNKSQEIIPSKYNYVHNNRNYSSLINEKTSRNKIIFNKKSINKNNSCLSFKSPKISNRKNIYSMNLNNHSESKRKIDTIDYERDNIVLNNQTKNNNYINNNNNNNLELQLAYKVIEFISILNNVQSSINNNLDLKNQKDKYELLKNNIESLTNKVIKQKNSGINNKNIINNNFIYNSDIISKNKNDNIYPKDEKYKDKINQLINKIKDLELLIKKKDKENQKLINQIKFRNTNKKNELNAETNNIKVFKNSLLINKIEEINKLNYENKNYIDQIKNLKRENEILKNNNNKSNSKRDNNKNNNNELILKSNELNPKINNMNNKNDLKNILQEKEKEIKNLKNNIIILRKKNFLIEKEFNSLNNISNKNKQFNNLNTDIKNKITYNIEGIKNNGNDEYKNKCYILEKDKNGLRNELEKLKNKYDEINISFKNLENKNGIIDLQKKQLTQKNKNYEKEIEDLNNKIIKYQKEIKYLNENKKNNELQNIDENNNQIKLSIEPINNIQNKIDNNFEVIKESSKENEPLETESNDANDNGDNNNNKINNENNSYKELYKENKKLKEKIVELKNEIKYKNNSNNIISKYMNIINNNDNNIINNNEIEYKDENDNNLNIEEIMNVHKKEIKDKDMQIEYLNNEIQELKTQIEEKECVSNISNITKENEYKEIINEYESKINFLNQHNNYYQNTLNEYKNKIKENENEIEKLKNNNKNKNSIFMNDTLNITNNNFSIISNKCEIKYNSEKYEILCDKYYNNFHWFLLIEKKNKEDGIDNINNLFWAEKINLDNLEHFNHFISEVEEKNQMIIQNISKLEEKENIISKLSFKIKNLESQNEDVVNTINNNSNNNNINEGYVPLLKFNALLEKLNESEEKIKNLQKENKLLKENKKKKNIKFINNTNNKEININDIINKSIKIPNIIDNNLNYKSEGNNKNNGDSMEINYDKSSIEISDNRDKIKEEKNDENESNEENYENSEDDNEESEENEDSHDNTYDVNKLINELNKTKYLYKQIENTLLSIKEALKKLFSDLVIPEKEEEMKNVLKMCGFTEIEISKIINKK